MKQYQVAFVGNPNVGKSAWINALSNAHFQVGNWPGAVSYTHLDYDDWSLNGDILIYYPILDCAVEISSMGIRVDAKALQEQLKKADCEERLTLPYHQMLLHDELPLTIGGGIGQSRICLILLNKAHIGEVQVSQWLSLIHI